MKKGTRESKSQMPAPRVGTVIELATTYGEVPIAIEAAWADLLASLGRGEDDRKAGGVKRMSASELQSDMRADFERITGYKIS